MQRVLSVRHLIMAPISSQSGGTGEAQPRARVRKAVSSPGCLHTMDIVSEELKRVGCSALLRRCFARDKPSPTPSPFLAARSS